MGGALPCRQLIEAREGLKGREITNHSQQGCAERLKCNVLSVLFHGGVLLFEG